MPFRYKCGKVVAFCYKYDKVVAFCYKYDKVVPFCYKCDKVLPFWCKCDKLVPFGTSVKAWVSIEADRNINFSNTETILGPPSNIPPIFDQYLTIKMHIYCYKFQNIVPGIEGFGKRIAHIKHIEKYIAVKNPKKQKKQALNQKWLKSDLTAL